MMFDATSLRDTELFAEALFDKLREASVDPVRGGVCRDTYGQGEASAHALVREYALAMGLKVSEDHMLNTYMTWPGRSDSNKKIVIGSHLDSVPAGGNYDGAAGVVSGLGAIALLKQQGVVLEHDLVIMGIRAEESAWFSHSYIGSRGALGLLGPQALQKKRFDTGLTLEEHLRKAGGDPDAVRRQHVSLPVDDIIAFFEVHIEQAPTLALDGHAMAIGTAIPGNVRYPAAQILGQYGHVGLPKRFRRDAALAASDLFMRLDRVWQRHEDLGIPMAFTIGEFGTNPERHGLTTISGEFRFSLDLRAYEASRLQELETTFLALVKAVEQEHQVSVQLGPRASAKPAVADPTLTEALRRSSHELGLSCPDLLSPASHDAAAFDSAGVPFGFLFIRNPNGSHHPDEQMAVDDWLLATQTLARTLWRLDGLG